MRPIFRYTIGACLQVLTDWKDFAKLDLRRLRETLRHPIILDGRNLYSREDMMKAGLNYYSVGRSPVESAYTQSSNQKQRSPAAPNRGAAMAASDPE